MESALDLLLHDLSRLSAAEEFLDYFGVAYEPAVVHVNRLHILKRFQQNLRTSPELADQDAVALRDTFRTLLARAYADFVRSTPAQEKVFKVFRDLDGAQVTLDSLRRKLPSQRNGA